MFTMFPFVKYSTYRQWNPSSIHTSQLTLWVLSCVSFVIQLSSRCCLPSITTVVLKKQVNIDHRVMVQEILTRCALARQNLSLRSGKPASTPRSRVYLMRTGFSRMMVRGFLSEEPGQIWYLKMSARLMDRQARQANRINLTFIQSLYRYRQGLWIIGEFAVAIWMDRSNFCLVFLSDPLPWIP